MFEEYLNLIQTALSYLQNPAQVLDLGCWLGKEINLTSAALRITGMGLLRQCWEASHGKGLLWDGLFSPLQPKPSCDSDLQCKHTQTVNIHHVKVSFSLHFSANWVLFEMPGFGMLEAGALRRCGSLQTTEQIMPCDFGFLALLA